MMNRMQRNANESWDSSNSNTANLTSSLRPQQCLRGAALAYFWWAVTARGAALKVSPFLAPEGGGGASARRLPPLEVPILDWSHSSQNRLSGV